MKFGLVGKRPSIHRDREPGSILGEKRICCYRCGEEFRSSELSTIPPGSEGTDRSKIYVCKNCR